MRPDAASFGAGAYFVLIALMFTTIRDLTTRGLASDIPSIFVAAASAAAISAAGFAVAPFDDAWRCSSERSWIWLTLAAGCLFIATTFMIVALRTGEVSVVAPFRYPPVPPSFWAGGGGTRCRIGLPAWGLFWVLAAGLYMLRRERLSFTSAKTTIADRSPAE